MYKISIKNRAWHDFEICSILIMFYMMQLQHLVSFKKVGTSFSKSLNLLPVYVILKFDPQSQYLSF